MRPRVVLDQLTPTAEAGWVLLLELGEVAGNDWLLLGGQMMYLLAVETSVALPRPTVDVDVVIDVRARPQGTRWLSTWLIDRGFSFEQPSADEVGTRFTRPSSSGLVVVDVLAVEGLGDRADILTRPPARTVMVPGSAQAFRRAETIEVAVACATGEQRTGRVRRPSALGALIAKAAATGLAVRANPMRDWQDAALALAMLADPLADRATLTKSDHRHLRALTPLLDDSSVHEGWAALTREQRLNGQSALHLLTRTDR